MDLWPYKPGPRDRNGINPPVSDSATFNFDSAGQMIDTFHGEGEGHFLYSRHSNPSNQMLEQSLASLEGTESAAVFGSGMGAITATLLQTCGQGDHIVASRTIYGGTFAFMKNFLPRVGVEVTFVNVQSLSEVEEAIRPETRLIYCESISNPLLRVADLNALAQKAEARNIPLVVDNTFTPLVIRPHLLGAQIVIHSLTKFINGNNDCLGGVVCSSQEFIDSLRDVNSGAAMLLGSTLDSLRSASLLKNLQTLSLRMRRHSRNALMLARALESAGYTVSYPGLDSHPDFEIIGRQHEEEYGFGGMLTLDAGSLQGADRLMQSLQEKGVGYLAVSLGFHKTLFSASGSSTSSEIPENEQEMMGLTDGLVRFSVGLDEDMPGTVEMILESLRSCEIPNGTVRV